MTKTDWTAEEVRARFTTWAASRGMDLDRIPPDTYRNIKTHASWVGYRAAFAERIEADESAVPVGHFCEMSPGQWEQTRHEFAGLLGVTPLFAHPPAQPAQEQPGWKVPDGWSGWCTQYPDRLPKLWGERKIAELNYYPDEGQRMFQVVEVAAAPTPPKEK